MAFGRGLMIGLAGAGQGILSASKSLKEYKLKEMDKENDRLADERAHNSRMAVEREKHELGEVDRLLSAHKIAVQSRDGIGSEIVKSKSDGTFFDVDSEGNEILTTHGAKLTARYNEQDEAAGLLQSQINKHLFPPGKAIVSPTVTETAVAGVTGDGTTVADLPTETEKEDEAPYDPALGAYGQPMVMSDIEDIDALTKTEATELVDSVSGALDAAANRYLRLEKPTAKGRAYEGLAKDFPRLETPLGGFSGFDDTAVDIVNSISDVFTSGVFSDGELSEIGKKFEASVGSSVWDRMKNRIKISGQTTSGAGFV